MAVAWEHWRRIAFLVNLALEHSENAARTDEMANCDSRVAKCFRMASGGSTELCEPASQDKCVPGLVGQLLAQTFPTLLCIHHQVVVRGGTAGRLAAEDFLSCRPVGAPLSE